MNFRIWKAIKKSRVFRRDLWTILSSVNPKAPFKEQVEWLEEIISWIRIPTKPDEKPTPGVQHIQNARVKFLLMILDRTPDLREKVAQTLSSILLETHSVVLFSEVGINSEQSFLAEATDRVLRQLVPMPADERDLAELFNRVFGAEDDAQWVAGLDEGLVSSLHELLTYDDRSKSEITELFKSSIKSSLIALTAQAAAIGVSPEIRARSQVRKIRESAFIELTMKINSVFDNEVNQEWISQAEEITDRCLREAQRAMAHLNRYSVSVSLVYRLELLEQSLDRISTLLNLLHSDKDHRLQWKRLIADLIRTRFESTKLSGLIRSNLHLLARKIVERTGASGEHYIARTSKEYTQMLLSAAGGGILTAGTTILKFLSTAIAAAPLIEGLLLWISYSGSFLLMQKLHFTLATKQPSMTAPALASKLTNLDPKAENIAFINEIKFLTRSQFAAAIGNIGLVIPTAIALDFIWRYFTGGPVISSHYAHQTILSLDPLETLTVPFAALTGVWLWLSSIFAGWCENWVVYRRIPEAMQQTGGKERSSWLLRNISGFAGNISLGFLLAFTPILGKFSGLPLDVRHITLSTGALTFAVCSLGLDLVDPYLLSKAVIGIVIIGVLNFGVSFALALYTAVRARSIRSDRFSEIRSKIFKVILKNPIAFLVPLKTPEKL